MDLWYAGTHSDMGAIGVELYEERGLATPFNMTFLDIVKTLLVRPKYKISEYHISMEFGVFFNCLKFMVQG